MHATRNPVYLVPLTQISDEFFAKWPVASAKPCSLRGFMRENPRAFAVYEAWIKTKLAPEVHAQHGVTLMLLDKIGQVYATRRRGKRKVQRLSGDALTGAIHAHKMAGAKLMELHTQTKQGTPLTREERTYLRRYAVQVLKLVGQENEEPTNDDQHQE